MRNEIRVLIISPEYPYPPTNGHKLRMYNLFNHFPDGIQFDFMTLGDAESNQDPETLRRQLGSACKNIELISSSTLNRIERGWFEKIRNLIFPYEDSVGDPYISDAMAYRVKEKTQSGRYNLVFLCGLYIALHFDKKTESIPYIVDMADSISLYLWNNFKAAKGPIEKIRKYFNYVWGERYEKINCSQIPNIIMCTDVDAQQIRKNCPKSQVWSVPAGVDTNYYQPANNDYQKNNMLFTGVMNYDPNDLAMSYFIKNILPLIRKDVPDATLTIAGRDPTNRLKSLVQQTAGVQLTGFVEDLRPHFEAAEVCVAPLITGAGIKNKILEAWAMGKPVVATSLSCSGIEIVEGDNLLIADTPQEFARKVVELLADKKLRDKLAQNGRATVEQKYSWSTRSRMVKDIINEVLKNDSRGKFDEPVDDGLRDKHK